MKKNDKENITLETLLKEEDFLQLSIWQLEERIGLSWTEYFLGEEEE